MHSHFRSRRPSFAIPVMAERADNSLSLARSLASNAEQLAELSRLVTAHVTNADSAATANAGLQTTLVNSTAAVQSSLQSLAAAQSQLVVIQSAHATRSTRFVN